MPGKRTPKKSDPLVVRMPHEDKEAFLEACRKDGRTASDVVRDMIAGYVQRATMRERLREIQPQRSLAMIWKSPKTRLAAGASAAAAALASVALLSAPSVAAYDYRASFETLDANRDGMISMEEYAGGGSHSILAFDLTLPEGGVTLTEAAASATGVNLEALGGRLDGVASIAYTMDIGFGVTDVDGDGSVDFTEFVARHEQLLADEFANEDADGDGRLTYEELLDDVARQGFPATMYDAHDRDGDGAITLGEFQLGPKP